MKGCTTARREPRNHRYPTARQPVYSLSYALGFGLAVVGTTISHYRVVKRLGAGGMGIVYLAEDTRLKRNVALKFLPPASVGDTQATSRLLREAQTASALDHPNLATVYEVGEWQQQPFIAMAFYDGETLKERLERGQMSVNDAVAILTQVATGLVAAHRAGIVHRDLKPANIMLTRDQQVKILDFGLASMTSEQAQTMTRLTGAGTVVGTVGYMAPEQMEGMSPGPATDVWALGVIAYEMLSGRLPFSGSSTVAAALALAKETPAPLTKIRSDVPDQVAQLVQHALDKAPERRISAEDFRRGLNQSASQPVPILQPRMRSQRLPFYIAAAVVVVGVAGGFGVRSYRREARVQWAREQAIPEIQALVEQERFSAAFRLAAEAKPYIPSDPAWARLDPIISRKVSSITTNPPGATISYRPYGGTDSEWVTLGHSPLTDVTVPAAFFEWKIEKPGFALVQDAAGFSVALANTQLAWTLSDPKDAPPAMVRVNAGDRPYGVYIAGLDHLPAVQLHDFWIERFEVTNRQFKQFVDAGGYRSPSFWHEPFVRNGRALDFEQAMALLTDTTGRPGPATWESGTYPEGQEDFPVTGVSWYEAAAYATFAGESLPTIYHWGIVAEQRTSTFVVPLSNFGGKGPVKVGSSGAMNRFGAFDMAGNVKEWCWNRADETKRFILGGGWDEPTYLFNDPDARSPFDRAPNFGFRTVKYAADDTAKTAGGELIAFERRNFNTETPIGDQVFDAYRRMYAYDKTDLKATVDSVDDTSPDWRRESVSFAAAYGGQRVPAFLYLPKGVKPPYQTIVYFPGSSTLSQRSSDQINPRNFDWMLKSGRALIHPIYKSTFERGDEITSDYPNATNVYRDHVIMWSKDVARTIDYLETRKEISTDRLAYYGASWGAAMGPIFVAVEPRFKAALWQAAGLYLQRPLPEVDAFNFAPRVRVPTLMLDGRFDFFIPSDTSQEPMFRLIGVHESLKRRVLYDTGHNIPRPEMVRETLDWLDKYLGPVAR
jgi:eukaryotic-like serine/threonine-protein kinase